MPSSYFVTLISMTFVSGCAGSLFGAAITVFGGEPRVPLGKSTGIGFLIGAGFGATFAIFKNLTA